VAFTVWCYTVAVYAVVMCLSIICQYCTKMVKHRITQTKPYDRPRTLVFWHQRSRQNSNRATPMEVPNRGGVGSDRPLSTNISLYLRKGARQKHSYYRMFKELVCILTNGDTSSDLEWPNYPKPPHFWHLVMHLRSL